MNFFLFALHGPHFLPGVVDVTRVYDLSKVSKNIDSVWPEIAEEMRES